MAARLTAIEINGTFYSSQTPATFRKWAAETPAGFRFALKAPRYAVIRHAFTRFTPDECRNCLATAGYDNALAVATQAGAALNAVGRCR